MKNQHILPNTEVPFELRQEIYKEALKVIKDGNLKELYPKWHTAYLCWMLPSLLWGYDAWVSWEADLSKFHHKDTLVIFPELNSYLGHAVSLSNRERIEFLKSVIQ